MAQLGYDRFIAQGGDWGAIVTRRLGEAYADRLLGVHFNMLFALPASSDRDPVAGITDTENARFAAAATRIADGTSYMAIQSTKPETLSYGLTDSPTGLAAWILEKFQVRSDLDEGGLARTYGWERLLDNVMAYWVTNTAGSAARLFTSGGDCGRPTVERAGRRADRVLASALRADADAAGVGGEPVPHCSLGGAGRGGLFACFERQGQFVIDLRTFRRVLAGLG